MPTTIYLIRHGVCDSVDHRLNGRKPGVRLTADGQRQAQSLVQFFSNKAIHKIYSSPLLRAQETAKPIADFFSLPITNFEEFNEVDFGEWTGRSFQELQPLKEWSNFNLSRAAAQIPGGESWMNLQKRTQQGLTIIRDLHPNQNVIIVSHSDVIRTTLMYVLGAPIDNLLRLEVLPASISTIQLSPGFHQICGINIKTCDI